jgi:hypothetical protein
VPTLNGSIQDCLGRLPPSRLRRYGGQAACGLSSEARTASGGGRPQADTFAGGHRSRAPPVPIPNTEVKPATADGTVWETVWESRSLPALLPKARDVVFRAFLFSGQRPNRRTTVSHATIGGAAAPRAATRRAVRKPLYGKRYGRVGRCRHYYQRKTRCASFRASGLLFVGRPPTVSTSCFSCRPSAAQPPREPRRGEQYESHCMGNGMGE